MSIILIYQSFKSDYFIYAQEPITSLKFLQTQPNGITLSLLDITKDKNIIQAIAQKPDYLSDYQQLGVLQIDSSSRLAEVENLKKRICSLTKEEFDMLDRNNIKYVMITPTICVTETNNKPLWNADPIYSSEQVQIYLNP